MGRDLVQACGVRCCVFPALPCRLSELQLDLPESLSSSAASTPSSLVRDEVILAAMRDGVEEMFGEEADDDCTSAGSFDPNFIAWAERALRHREFKAYLRQASESYGKHGSLNSGTIMACDSGPAAAACGICLRACMAQRNQGVLRP